MSEKTIYMPASEVADQLKMCLTNIKYLIKIGRFPGALRVCDMINQGILPLKIKRKRMLIPYFIPVDEVIAEQKRRKKE